MFKKIMMSTIGFALSSSIAFANAVPYVGADLGGNQNYFQLTNPNTSPYFSAPGLFGGVFAGYGGVIYKKFYLAGEFFFNDSTARSSTKVIDNLGDTAQMLSTYSYGLALLPGYQFTLRWMAYGKVGFLRTHFQLNPTAITGLPTANATPNGGELGVGLQYQFKGQLDLRAEYTHATYRNFSLLQNNISATENMIVGELVYRIL